MKLELKKSNRQSSTICRQSSVVSLLSGETRSTLPAKRSPLYTWPSTSVENLLQISSFMQNKPNSPIVQNELN
jgi:hypothetical protein